VLETALIKPVKTNGYFAAPHSPEATKGGEGKGVVDAIAETTEDEATESIGDGLIETNEDVGMLRDGEAVDETASERTSELEDGSTAREKLGVQVVERSNSFRTTA
jgi:hypothetical protein